MSLRIIEWKELVSPLCEKNEPRGMTIGIFDGVHRGHVELIRCVIEYGKCPTVLTFRQHPQKILKPENYPGNIFCIEQKLAVFEELGIEQVILIDFSEDFSRMKGQEFINLLIDKGNLNFLVIGSGFRCGYRQDTGAELIKSMNEAKGIPTKIISPIQDETGPISSSRIRMAITQGNLSLAAALLGRNVELVLGPKKCVPWHTDWKITEEMLILDVSGRLIPPPERYRVLLQKTWEVDIVLRDGKVFIPFSTIGVKDLESWERIKIEFLP